jgi:tetraacyldisaccharide 4'-kinase
VSRFGAEILLLDDGFQHHRLVRDLDIVSLDGRSGLGNGRVLPAGPLREPSSSLRHADWICLVDGDGAGGAPPGAARWLAKLERAKRFVFRARRRPSALFSLDGQERRPLGDLAGRRVGLISGIARPGSFRRSVESLGAIVVRERHFRDHHAYAPRDLRGLDPDVELWLTTEKDAIKILPSWAPEASIWVLQIELEIEDEAAVLAAIETALQASGRLSAREGARDSTRPERSTEKRAPLV